MSLAVSMPALALPEIGFQVGEMCFQFTLVWTERRNSHKTCSSWAVANMGPAKCHDQLPEQLLYPGSVLLPFTPSTAPPKSTSQHPQQGQWWWHCVAPCSSATTQDRAGESSTQSWRNLHPALALPHCSALILAWQPMPGSHRFYPRSAKLLHPQAAFRDWHANKLTAASDCDN